MRASIRFRLRLLCLGCLLLGSVSLAGCAGAQASRRSTTRGAYDAYLRGLMLERSARLPDAVEAYEEALTLDRTSAHLHVRIGAAEVKMGNPRAAREAFRRALALDPDSADALRWLAMLDTSDGNLEAAILAYERLWQLDPSDQFVLSTLADLYVLQGRVADAIPVYDQLLESVGPSSQLFFNLGVLHGRLEDYPEALTALSKAFELSPEAVELRVALGLTYEMAGRPATAAAHYEEAVRADPFNPRLYHYAARAWQEAREYPRAVANYQAVLDLTAGDLEAIMGLVRVWIAQRQFDRAAAFLGDKLQELGDPPELYVALGIVYREAEYVQEALRAFEQALRRQDAYAQAHFYYAAQLDALGRKVEARQSLRRTLELEPDHPDALNYLGYLDAEAGVNLAEAKRLIERALELDPENGAYLDSLGWVYFQLGDLGRALTLLERAAQQLDSDPVILDHLGDVHVRRHDVDAARRAWQRALELDPDAAEIREKLQCLPAGEAAASTP